MGNKTLARAVRPGASTSFDARGAVSQLKRGHSQTLDVTPDSGQHSPGSPGISLAPVKPNAGHAFAGIPVRPPLPLPVQAKLSVSQPDDKYEQEADRVADDVMRTPEPTAAGRPDGDENKPKPDVQAKPIAGQITPLVKRQAEPQPREDEGATLQLEDDEENEVTTGFQCRVEPGGSADGEGRIDEEEEEKRRAGLGRPGEQGGSALQRRGEEEEKEEEMIPTKRASGTASRVPRRIEQALESVGGGDSLPAVTREFFESRFGHDFSRVRVHHDAGAAQLARTLHAQAFTRGEHVFFAAGRYVPQSDSGRRLLAHELTHAVQQAGHRPLAVGPSPSAIAADRNTSSVPARGRSGSSAIPVVRMRVETGSHLARRDDDRPAPSPT